MAPGDAVTSMSDEDTKSLVSEMRQKSLATDQKRLVAQTLSGRSLTCKQAAELLQQVNLGIMQRILVVDILHPKLSDFPAGLSELMAPLSPPIQVDVQRSIARNRNVRAISSSDSSYTSYSHRSDEWANSLDQLRDHVNKGEVPESLYEDLSAVLCAHGLESMVPKGGSAGTSSTASPVQFPPRHLSPQPTRLPSQQGEFRPRPLLQNDGPDKLCDDDVRSEVSEESV